MPSGSSLLRLAILLFICLVLTTGEARAQEPDDHGDTLLDATSLTLGATVTGVISPAGDTDLFRFEIPGTTETTDVWIYTQGGISDSVGALYDGKGTRIASNDDSALSTNAPHFYIGANLGPGTYYVAVSGYRTVTGPYSLHTRTAADQGGTVPSPGERAADLTPGAPVEGIIGPGWEQDVFRIDLSAASGPTDVVLYTTGNVDTIGEILDDNSRQIASNDDSILSDERYDFFLGAVLEPGVYYIFVSGYGTSTGPYKLHSWTGTDQPGSRASSAALRLESEQLGIIGSSTDEDYFRITLSKDADLQVYATGPVDTAGELFDSSGNRLAYNDDSAFSLGSGSFFIAKSLSPGTYYVAVSGFAGETGPYRVYAQSVADQTNVQLPRGRDAAAELTLRVPVIGLIDPGADADLFKLELTHSREVFIYTAGDVDTVGELFKSDGTTLLAQNDDHSAGAGLNFFIGRELDAGTYYIRVQGYQPPVHEARGEPETGPYALFAEPVLPVELVDIGQRIITEGYIAEVYDENYYKIDIANTADVWIFDTGALDTVGTLYDSNFNKIAFNDDSLILGRYRAFHIRETLDPGNYYVKAGSFGTDTGIYAVHFYAVTEPHNNSETSAALLEPGLPTAGTIDPSGQGDYFRLDFTENTNIFLYGRSVSGAFIKGEVLDRQGNTVGVNEDVLFRDDGFIIRDTFAPGTYYVKVTTPPGAASLPVLYTIHAFKDAGYNAFVTGCTAGTAGLTTPGLTLTAGDDLYTCQWHLKNHEDEGEDINVEPVWAKGITGQGVNVAVVDDGMDHYHEDLAPNVYASRNFDYTGEGDVHHSFEHHGTAVAGVIAARDNSFGVRGVAPRATIHGHNFLTAKTVFSETDSMTRNRIVTAVSNNSWGPVDGPGLGSADAFWESAVETGVKEGYGGKGVFYAFSAGNGALRGDEANLDEVGNFYAVTAVCAVNDRGRRSNFSEPGASLWVCAPSNDLRGSYRGIVTTENSDRYRNTFGGTSAAAPIVSGVAALLRQANPDLTWRDLKLVLAASARKNDPANSGWEDGAQKYGPDSATDVYTFNHEYGFGVVDAAAAVALADGWTTVAPLEREEVESAKLDRPIPDASATGASTMVSHTLMVNTGIEFIEFVEVRASFLHSSFRDLEIELVSPSGKASKLLSHYDPDDLIPLIGEIRFGSARHLGENPNGRWTLRVTDRIPGGTGSLESWTIKVYGHRPAPAAPTVDSVTPGRDTLTVAWSAPAVTRASAVAAYDLRYIPTSADETDDANWTVVENVWTAAGGGALTHNLTGLVSGVQYDVQARAVNAAGPGPWSETVTGIPAIGAYGCSGAAVPSPTINPALVNDCEALLDLRDTLANGAPLNWSASLPLAYWDGVIMGGSPPRIIGLKLSEKALAGHIPSGLGSLTALQFLNLSDNGLTWTIPPSLGNLRNLERLYLSENQLTGPVPSWLGGLTNLTHLSLWGNQLTGPIPSSLGNLANLEFLSLSRNPLGGEIPPQLGKLRNLERMILNEARLTGPVPSWLGNLTSLTILDLGGNQLTGPIPADLGNLHSLERLDLSENRLTGPIPSWLGGLTNLVELSLWGNGLTGPVPSSLGNLVFLVLLSLSQNPLGGEIPPELGNLRSLERLYLNENRLTGPIPSWLGDLAGLTVLSLRGNELTGPIPSSLGGLTNLEVLSLSRNPLGGTIPPRLGKLRNLKQMHLDQTQLTGPIPVELGGLANLEILELSHNELTGLVPHQLVSLANVVELSLSENRLRGQIPFRMGDLANLQELELNRNQLTGEIPSSLGNLHDLERLSLSENQLTGPIPSSLGNLHNLERLYLNGNLLIGPIPSWLGDLISLTVLTIGGNQLTGPIPSSLGDLTDLEGLYLYENQLTGPIPARLGNLTSLTVLSLPGNRLTGPIPSSLGNLTDLEGLYLNDNQLTGPIPAWLGDLASLAALSLSQNPLGGAIPPELGNLRNLVRLHLNDNQLTGEPPSALGNLRDLEWLYLNGNRLTGPIPAWIEDFASLQHLRLEQNLFTGKIPPWLANLDNLEVLYLAQDGLTGCIPKELRAVADNDLAGVGLVHCDVLLSGLSIRPGTLAPQFDPYRSEYTVLASASRITVTPANEYGADFRFLDVNDVEIADADGASDGHQIDLADGDTTVKVKVVSQDQAASHTYTVIVTLEDVISRYDKDGDGRISKDEVIAAIRDYFKGIITKDQTIAVIRVYFSSV